MPCLLLPALLIKSQITMWQEVNCKHCQILTEELDTCLSGLMYLVLLVCAKPCALQQKSRCCHLTASYQLDRIGCMQKATSLFLSNVFRTQCSDAFFPPGVLHIKPWAGLTLSTQNSPFQCKTPSDFLSNSWALSILRPGLLWARNWHGKWALQFLLSYPNSHPHSTLQTQNLTPLHLESNTGPSADCPEKILGFP